MLRCGLTRTVAAILLGAVLGPAPGFGGDAGPTSAATDHNGRFVLNGAEAVDRKTGLIWHRCMVGRSLRDGICIGQTRFLTWFDAMNMHDGAWRVPNQAELQSLYQEQPGFPRLSIEAFPDAAQNPQEYYWTSNEVGSCLENGNRPCAEVVGFNGAGAAYSPWGGVPGIFHLPVRMVRDGTPPDRAAPPTSASETRATSDRRWLIRGATAIDTDTHLAWQRCAAGRTWSAALGCRGVVREYTFDQAVALQGDGWRLPTARENDTLYYHGTVAPGLPLLDAEVFPDVDPNHAAYWTITPATDCPRCTQSLCGDVCYTDASGAKVAKDAFCGNFAIGWNAMVCGKTQQMLVRLVRPAE